MVGLERLGQFSTPLEVSRSVLALGIEENLTPVLLGPGNLTELQRAWRSHALCRWCLTLGALSLILPKSGAEFLSLIPDAAITLRTLRILIKTWRLYESKNAYHHLLYRCFDSSPGGNCF